MKRSGLSRLIVLSAYLGCLVFLDSNPAHAIKQFRCSGKVQYRPCDDNRAFPGLKNQPKLEDQNQDLEPRAQMKRGLIAPTVFSTKYEYNKKNEVGIWTGFVHGEGAVILRLRLNSPGVPPETRYMGKAVLRGKVSPFEFRSMPPKGSRWSWQIFAKSEDS